MMKFSCTLLLVLTACVSTEVDSKPAPTRAPTPATTTELAVIRELNAARQNPKQYADYLRQLRTQFKGKDIVRGNTHLRTREGTKAVDEAIKFLRNQKSVPPLSLSPGLAEAARDHAREQSASGSVGHKGKDGSMVDDRVNRYGTWLETIGENIAYGYADPRDVVMQLIIDDGVPDRGHRTNIFNPQFRRVGIANATHPNFRHLSVHVFAGDFKPNK